MKYSLDSLSKDYLKDKKYKYDLKEKSQAAPYFINDPMTNMHKLPYELVKEYAEQDVNLTLRLWRHFEKKLDQEEKVEAGEKFEKIKTLRPIFELETELFPCLVDMKFKGVRVDVQKAHTMKQELAQQEYKLIQEVKKATVIAA